MFELKILPDPDELWKGIGGYFDNLTQIICEFVDNSISNCLSNSRHTRRYITVRLTEKQNQRSEKYVSVRIEDAGTGIKNLEAAFTLGSRKGAESPLNEHGFGLKHALASADPENQSWQIMTRTSDEGSPGSFKQIKAPYKLEGLQVEELSQGWTGTITGTIVCFNSTWEMFRTVTKGLKGNYTSFGTIVNLIAEDLGFIYSGIIEEGFVINIEAIDESGEELEPITVKAVSPEFESYYQGGSRGGSGSITQDLGGGNVSINYVIGFMKEHSEWKKYYKKNMSTSGVEVRVNGRIIAYNLFKEIWNIEKHNSYNPFLVRISLASKNIDALPCTLSSKNGFRQGDSKFEKLVDVIRMLVGNDNTPPKVPTESTDEREKFKILKDRIQSSYKMKNELATVLVEKYAFNTTCTGADKIRIDLFVQDTNAIYFFEGKIDQTHAKDLYQLRMYWDGLVADGIQPSHAFLIGKNHSGAVNDLVNEVNNMKDCNGNNYNVELVKWSDYQL
ncbi:ATP-binding protein [uncultured Sphaerochaeta sp.]|uniref:ATP-binding protein n=1 Tax=uncultured Sphaerochaeta sp. TaxID=886478 RepID=UPI002AA8FA17|nr:ATP-binding protein [uncultured Sphaerochaeta sp.]